MRLLFLALTQATGGVPVENKIDLPAPQQCKAQAPANEEIIVCGRRNNGESPYRIRQTPPPPSAIPKAEIQIGEGVSAGAEVEKQDVGGFPSNRAMVRLKIKF